MLTQARLKDLLHYDPDTGVFTNRINRGTRARAGDVAGSQHNRGYLKIKLEGSFYLLHRLAYLYMTGAWPPYQIDHINGNKTDNHWKNLRAATGTENHRNCKKFKNNTSGLMGVYWNKHHNKLHAEIWHSGKRHHLGYFNSFFDACCARKSAEITHNYHQNHGR